MGVKGLWKLIECSGVPVPLETLEHKILGVDVSIWLHQAVRGFRGPGGAAVANAHLLTLFHRICKLLFYRIRPVFVFDGGVPHLKKQTLASRRLRREVAASKAKQVRERLLSNLLKSQAVRNALGKSGPGPSAVHVARPKKVQKDIFELPPLPEEGKELFKSEPDDDKKSIVKNYKLPNLHQFDFDSEEFKALPLETQHDILSDLQGTRKENSWNALNQMPQESNNFAEFQMGRLMKRHKFQSTLNGIRTEMQKKKAAEMEEEMFGELEKHVSLTQRIVSEDSAHSVFIKKISTSTDELDVEGELKQEEHKGKALVKRDKETFEKDFLTELERQGIVSARRASDSESDSDVDDDYYDFTASGGSKETENPDKLKFDGNAILKVVNSLLDNDGLSQDEILSLIKQSGPGEEAKKSNSNTDNFDGPSTSGKAPGYVFNPDVDSSDDDSDFIEVPKLDSPSSLLESKTVETEDDTCIGNVKKVLETKNDSLWIKIMQQRLDDIVHTTNEKTSPKKALVDSRSISNAKVEDRSKKDGNKGNAVSISLDFDVIHPLKAEDDIFADIFSDDPSENAPVKFSPVKKRHSNLEAITKKLTRYSDIQSKQLASSVTPKARGVKDNISASEVKDKASGAQHSQIYVNSKLSDKPSSSQVPQSSQNRSEESRSSVIPPFPKKIDEVELMSSSDESDSENKTPVKENKSIVSASPEKRNLSLEVEDEAAVDDVEIMSSSGESDSDLDESGKQITYNDKTIMSEVSKPVVEVNEEKFESKEKAIETPKTTGVEKLAHIDPPCSDQSPKSLNNGKVYLENERSLKSGNLMAKAMLSEANSGELKVSDGSDSDGKLSKKEDLDNELKISKEASESQDIEGKQQDLKQDNQVLDTPAQDDVEEVVGPERPLEYSEDELKRLEGELAEEQSALVAQAQKVDRISSNLNDQMYGESQHLLQLFGLPYLVAPMEAEAQCAYLDAVKLTNGTITDDSDIFLFGGTKVYKNFFNQAKHVEHFKTDNIYANLGLNRDKMITLALLTGSDYTEGIESVGAVSAMEVLAEFPGEGINCLQAFKKWWNVAHRNVTGTYMSKVKQKMSQVNLPESFPSERVFEAYIKPEVDESKEKFSWAIPNVDALRMFTMEKFGWNRAKADEILLPVMKKLGVKTTQMRIDSFFTNIKLVKDDKVHSKRMQDAIARAKGETPPSTLTGKSPVKRPGIPQGKKPPAKKRKISDAENSVMEEEEEEEQEDVIVKAQVKKPSRTLLIDPSESRTGPGVPQEKPKAKGGKAKTKKKEGSLKRSKEEMEEQDLDQRKTEEEESRPKKSKGPGRSMREVEEFVPPRKLTKEIMFKSLLQKQTISQRESEKQQMEERKKQAAELLKISGKAKKR